MIGPGPRLVLIAVTGALGLVGLAGCGSDGAAQPGLQAAATTTVAKGPTVTPGAVTGRAAGPAPETIQHAAQWPAPARDLGGSRAVTDSPITAATVGRLAPAWSVPLPGSGVYGNAASGPIVLGDTVLVQDLSSTIRAIDLATGKVRWTRTYDALNIGPNGPAAGYGKVFAAKGTTAIAAVDLKTGNEEWSTKLTRTATEGIDIQPQVYGGLVFAATVPISLQGQYTGGDRGTLYALDARTGAVRWSFDTVKGDDLWGDPTLNSGGGAWYPPTIDEDTGLIYWGIANPAPFPGTAEHPNGSSRPGANLYTDSVVALDVQTGKLRWYHQVVTHDIFDRDLVHTMIVPTGSSTHPKVLVATGKLGRVVGLDPVTGDELWNTPVGRHHNDDRTKLDGSTTILPGTYGGVLTPPASADGMVYTAVVNAPSTLAPDEESYLGTPLGTMPGTMAAVDATTGKVRWSSEIDGDPLGGTTVVGDLVFTGTQTGRLIAFDRTTGKEVWRTQAPGGLNGWPAVVGDTIVWPIGSADPPQLVAYRLR